MTNLRSEFGILKGKAEDNEIKSVKLNSTHFLREAHGIQEGIRKDKKIKINKKFK
ncbi:hypothetical protein C672_3077 [[Clostridium] bifermentans ATCC 638]|uniref:Uncharacterized protein n=1 Tax=Paraclostridium bifermentans ATCC 638 = DSM 14991 TaxID=1233171 RepID=T4VKM9_PARBF|nr:hypothetical protein [Paraclostridium bifermentans]EQK41336.1 hypothetical protein C672_3077 [[Clostridium] bifermentans ATCC 638] [Paraclostridium bifermentans ATCC 638 = DSM 14991]MCE9676053.1 hypothetical protein [Paraclostridium bifermentans]MDM8127068.1 hypothetical protein [Paraclostridium benzoelyticum]UAG18459.1 hypothetical protein KXZ80_01735 [Paraclostridium bifermentans]